MLTRLTQVNVAKRKKKSFVNDWVAAMHHSLCDDYSHQIWIGLKQKLYVVKLECAQYKWSKLQTETMLKAVERGPRR